MRLIFTKTGLAEAALILGIFWTAAALAAAQARRQGLEGVDGEHELSAPPIGSSFC